MRKLLCLHPVVQDTFPFSGVTFSVLAGTLFLSLWSQDLLLFSLGESTASPTRLELWVCDEGDWRRLGQKHDERVTADLMTKGSLQWSNTQWQGDRYVGRAALCTKPCCQLASETSSIKGLREEEPQPSGHFGNQKRKHSPTHLLPECVPKLQENWKIKCPRKTSAKWISHAKAPKDKARSVPQGRDGLTAENLFPCNSAYWWARRENLCPCQGLRNALNKIQCLIIIFKSDKKIPSKCFLSLINAKMKTEKSDKN